MFAVGDRVLYGTMGVCTIEDICKMDVSNVIQEYYLLVPHYVPNSKIYAPVENNKVEMRQLLSKRQAHQLIESLPTIKPFSAKQEKQEFYDLCRSTIRSGDSAELAKLLKTLHSRKRTGELEKKSISLAEKDFFDKAEMILHGELASVIDIPIEDVAGYIENQVGPLHTEYQGKDTSRDSEKRHYETPVSARDSLVAV